MQKKKVHGLTISNGLSFYLGGGGSLCAETLTIAIVQ